MPLIPDLLLAGMQFNWPCSMYWFHFFVDVSKFGLIPIYFRSSVNVQSILLSRSYLYLFMGPTSTKQWGLSFLLKETAGTLDGVQTHGWW